MPTPTLIQKSLIKKRPADVGGQDLWLSLDGNTRASRLQMDRSSCPRYVLGADLKC